MDVPFRRIQPGVSPPQRAHPGDAGADLQASVSVELAPGGRAMVPTGLSLAIPEGYAGLVVPRSGLAARHGIGIVNAPGLIDSGYRGEIKVLLVNHGSESVVLEAGERIAQLVITPVTTPTFSEVDELPETQRGEEGFGSTGR